MSIELKVKSKHLGEEARIIRHEEHKQLGYGRYLQRTFLETNQLPNDWAERYELNRQWFGSFISLRDHRTTDVRNENRATFLARAFLKGTPYKSVEQTRKNEYKYGMKIVPRIVSMVNKYKSKDSEKVNAKTILEWSKLD